MDSYMDTKDALLSLQKNYNPLLKMAHQPGLEPGTY